MIDWDVHNALSTRNALLPYLPQRWHREFEMGLPFGDMETLTLGARPFPHIFRLDSEVDGGAPGSDLDLMREQLLDPYDVQKALLHPIVDFLTLRTHGEAGLAMMSALNDWMMAEWLDQDPRCAGAISLPFEDPLRSVVEIERLAPDHRWGKIMLPGKTREGLGHAKYWSIYEAACNYDIPVSIHVGGFSGSGPGPLFNYFLEHQVSYTMDVQAQVASLVCGGVFERFPTLRVALEETTIGWLPPFIWRFDRSWALLRLEAPISLQEPPSSVIRRHFWIATQPLDSPADIRELQEMFRHLNMDDHVLFSTDYPHWNFDDPNRVLPASSFDSEFRAKVLFDNARALLGKRGEIDG